MKARDVEAIIMIALIVVLFAVIAGARELFLHIKYIGELEARAKQCEQR